jgi:hypothetical protein
MIIKRVKIPKTKWYLILHFIYICALIATVRGIIGTAPFCSTETYKKAKALADNFKKATSVEM